MRVVVLSVLFLTFLGGVAAAVEDDDDDPKSAQSRVAKPKASEAKAPKPEAKAKPEAPKPETKAKPEAKAEPEPKPARPEPATVARPDPTAVAKVEPKAGARVEPKRADKPVKAEPKAAAPVVEAKAAEASRVDRPIVDPFPPPPPRNVRVRMLDGSNISGTVRAELSESLVIDCNLGLLSIPRARVSTISYEASGGAKRAPVQQLDDDLPPRKR